MTSAKAGRGLRFLLAVVDAEAAAHVEDADGMALPRSCSISVSPLAAPSWYGCVLRIGEPRCMCRPTMRTPRIAEDAAGHVENGFDVEAELDALDAGVGLDVRLGRQIGIDAQRHRGRLAQRFGHVGEGVQLVLALDVEEEDVVFQGGAELGVGLADAGEDDAVAAAAGRERAEQLAAAGHIDAGAVLDHEAADGQVGVGLDAVADERIDGGEGLLELAQVVQQRGLAVDVQRRAVGLGERADGHVFAVEDAVAVAEMIHSVESQGAMRPA